MIHSCQAELISSYFLSFFPLSRLAYIYMHTVVLAGSGGIQVSTGLVPYNFIHVCTEVVSTLADNVLGKPGETSSFPFL